jgi:hypothetical protein
VPPGPVEGCRMEWATLILENQQQNSEKNFLS